MWFDELSTRLPTVNIFPLIPGEKAGPTVLNRVDSSHTIERCHEASEVPNLRGVQLDVSGVDHVRPRSLRNSGAAVSTLLVIAPVPVAGYALMSILEPAHRMPLIEQMRGSGVGQKRRIGQAAARLTDDHSTVLILGGTLTRSMLPSLGFVRGLTVLSDSLKVVHRLSRHPNIDTIVLGGFLRR